MREVLAIVALALAGCTSVDITKHEHGGYTASLTRVWSDVAVTIETPDGGTLVYSSDADGAAAASQADRLLGVVERAMLPVQLRASE